MDQHTDPPPNVMFGLKILAAVAVLVVVGIVAVALT